MSAFISNKGNLSELCLYVDLTKTFSWSCPCSSKIATGAVPLIPVMPIWVEEVLHTSRALCFWIWLTCPLAVRVLTNCFIPAGAQDGSACCRAVTAGIGVAWPYLYACPSTLLQLSAVTQVNSLRARYILVMPPAFFVSAVKVTL